MEYLLLFLFLAALVIAGGHFAWLAIAGTIRFLAHGLPPESSAESLRNTSLSAELRDLEVTTRTIRQLLARGDLDAEAAERVERCLEARRLALQPQPRLPLSPLAQLEQLLGGGVHPRELTPEQRRQALACYRRLPLSQRNALKAPTLLTLARLLDMAGMTSHAVGAYRHLLEQHRELPDHASIALEAARLASRTEHIDLVRRFVHQALAGVLPETEYQEAQELLSRLDQSVRAPAAVLASPPPAIVPVAPVATLPTSESPAPPAVAVRTAPVPPRPPEIPVVLSAPPRPRRSLTNLLAAFMEERNILWGELAGGLLIVGCSIALVITLWHSLEALPYFPFLVFACITAALFSAGEYTLHHWKLESTSRGLLVIALLLVPLNLLVLADPSLGHASTVLEWTFKSAAVLLALGLVRLAARDLIGVGVLPGPIDRRWLFMLAIVGAAGSQLIVPRLLDEEHPVLYVILACVPVACHVLACGAVVAGLARARARSENQQVEVRQAHSLFVFLGLSAFTLFVALGFLLSRSTIALALPRLAEPFALASVPILAGGLLVRRGLPSTEVGPRTAGSAVAFTGLAFMLAAVVLAWPQPLPLLLVCASNAALLTFLAFRWRLPHAHAVALPCLALAILLVVQGALGNLTELPQADAAWVLTEHLTSPTSGIVLDILMALCAAGAESLVRIGERTHAVSYALGSVVLGIVALLTTGCHGFASPWPAVVVYTLAGGCSLAMHARWKHLALPYVGLSLLVAASLWALRALALETWGWWGFVLALESALLALAALKRHPLRDACRAVAVAVAVLALAMALVSPDFPDHSLHAGTAALLAWTAFVLAYLFRAPGLSWLGSTLVFAAVAHGLVWDLDTATPPRPLLMALLVHASLALLGGLLLQVRQGAELALLHRPLRQSAILTSLLAVPFLLVPGIAFLALAGYALWLAVVWLVLAVQERSPGWFSAFQLAITGAVIFAVNAGIAEGEWYDPYCLQAYGMGLALLGLAWVLARTALSANPRVRQLWEAPWPSVDRLILGALVTGQFALALWGILPGLEAEMLPVGYISLLTWRATAPQASSWGAWALLGTLGLVLLAALREKPRISILVGFLVLAATAPILAAAPFATQLATASALRWGLALCYLLCALLVWLRYPLGRLLQSIGFRVTVDSTALAWVHGILSLLAVTVLGLTMQVAILGFSGLRPSGPLPGSFFANMGWTASHVLPLLLLTVGMVGHAVRERWPLYAFVAGLLANVSVTGGYALAVVTGGQHLGTTEVVCLWQLAGLTAGLWVLAWMASLPALRGIYSVRADSAAIPSHWGITLMVLQIALALGSQLLLLFRAVFERGEGTGSLAAWAHATGSPLGWASLLASLASLPLWYRQQRRPLPWVWLFASGLAAVSLLACTVERSWPDAGCYFLLLGWPIYVLLWSALPVLRLEQGRFTTRLSWLSFAGFGERGAIILLTNLATLLWALQAALMRHDYLWASAAISLGALAAALLAAAQRNERLALLAGGGANLAAWLLLRHISYPALPSWVAVIQAHALASSSVALVWLGVRRLLGERQPAPLLVVQAGLGLALHTLLLCLPLLFLANDPGFPPVAFLTDIGSLTGWAALLLSIAAAYWQVANTTPRDRIHVLGLAGLSLGILAASTASRWDSGDWRSFHVLVMSWCVLGLTATILGSALFTSPPTSRWVALFPQRRLRHWLEGIGLAILTIVLPSCWMDPHLPLAPGAAVLTVSGMAAMLALWSRRPHYVWISGILLDVLAVLFWLAWGPDTVLSCVLANALGLAAAGALWLVIGLTETPEESLLVRLPHSSFVGFALNAALGLVVLVVVALLHSDLQPPRLSVSATLLWSSLGAVGVSLILALWDRRSWFAPPGLYILGLAALGLVLHQLDRSPIELGWYTALALACYALVASLIVRLSARSQENWLLPAQALVASVVIGLSFWICLSFELRRDRLAGPAAVLLLIPAALFLIGRDRSADNRAQAIAEGLRSLVLILGALAAAEIGWACPDPGTAAVWLHRNVLLMVVLAGMTALYGVALPRWLAHDAGWVRCGRRFGPLMGGLASLLLLVLLVQEFRLYDAATRHTPMAGPEVLIVVVALVTLMVSSIRFAVVPGRDPFGLSERGRGLYVYAVEVLLVLLFLHLRLNVPELFRGWGAKYWTLIVMVIAFLGVGLSEFFERRKLRVLADPLQRTGVFLPLLPLLAFWARPPATLLSFADTHAPGLRPLLGYLDKLPQHFDSYALLWLLVCGLYGLLFWTRRSFVFAVLAALAGNFALWSLLTHQGIAFLLHPQCWLIPPALILLAAEYANRDRLRPELSAGLRYLGISMIYVSSTADLFLAGLGNSIVLPIVLAVLSLAGILLGILFRIRAFLFLGISFLFLDVFTMIWYAAVDRYQTWVWWVSGIVLGAAILTLFAVFEKRRNDVLHLLEEIKNWQ